MVMDLTGLHEWISSLPKQRLSLEREVFILAEATRHALPPIPSHHPLKPWTNRADLVLSINVATQLILPRLFAHFGDAQICNSEPWSTIQLEVVRRHSKLIRDLLRPGGSGVIATEILSSELLPVGNTIIRQHFTDTVANGEQLLTESIR